MAPITQDVSIKVSPKVGVGLSTIVGLGAAGAQYIGVLAGVIDDGKLDANELGLLSTATVTLAVTIYGRMKQAAAALGQRA